MEINKLYFKNFRNLHKGCLNFHSNFNFFIGMNGQGKTNLLESVYFLATGSSHRTSIDKEVINWDKNTSIIQTLVSKSDQNLKLTLGFRGSKKSAQINNYNVCKISEFIGNLNVVLFAPEDLLLVKGSPANRREFLNIEIAQINPYYHHQLHKYKHILKQRNNLLKKLKYKEVKDNGMLDIWNEKLTDVGSNIIKKRLVTIEKIIPLARSIEKEITSSKEKLSIAYESCFDVNHEQTIKEIKKHFIDVLEKNKQQEINRGYTLYGPHRDDLELKYNNIDARKYGSQGQQRTIALSLKLAEIEFMKQETGEAPVLLLDDVFSELDESRRNALLNTVSNKVQTFITATELEKLEALHNNPHKVFNVVNGQIYE